MSTHRKITVKTPLGDDTLRVRAAVVTEQLGQPFDIDLQLLSTDENLDLESLLGKEITLSLDLDGGGTRYFHAYIAHFAQHGRIGRHAAYRVRAVPWLWFLTRTTDCRIFQQQSAPEIVRAVLREHGFTDFKDSLTRSYRKRDYCVQYRESDFNFVQRLMEEEGIYYFFRHTESSHTLVFADAYSAHEAVKDYEKVEYIPPSENIEREKDHIYDWHLARDVQSGKCVLTDFDFTKPRASLQTQYVKARTHAKANYEVFDYPGGYTSATDGDHYARLRLEAVQACFERVTGEGNARGLTAGGLFTLDGYPRKDQNKEYLLVSVTHRLQAGGYESGTERAEEDYVCSFEAIDAREPFHCVPTARKPQVGGPQTATVVGKRGEEIWTDKYGRVKVQFHWDRYGERNENSSCWVRVSQLWAGKNWGWISIPRIGQEVVVDFLEGDPDQPLIIGRVYNQDNMPPYGLPGAGVVSGIKSQTHKGRGFNEISLDDTTGQEKINIHGQYDLATTVQHDETHTVVSGNRAMTIQTGTNTETVKGNSSLTVQAGARTVDVTGGDYSATSSVAVKLHGKGAGVGITGNVGGVTLAGDGDGVLISGTGTNGVTLSGQSFIHMHGSSSASIQSPVVSIGDKDISVTGTKVVLSAAGGSITIDASGVTIQGTIVKIN